MKHKKTRLWQATGRANNATRRNIATDILPPRPVKSKQEFYNALATAGRQFETDIKRAQVSAAIGGE